MYEQIFIFLQIVRSKSLFLFQKNCGRPERKPSEPYSEIYKKEEPVFPVIKIVKEEPSEETNRPPKELKTDLEFHYKNYPETLKTLKEIYENKRLKISLSNTIIVDNVDTGVDIKTFLHSIKLKNAPVDPNYFLILKVLNLRPHLFKNNILRTQYGSDWFNYSFR